MSLFETKSGLVRTPTTDKLIMLNIKSSLFGSKSPMFHFALSMLRTKTPMCHVNRLMFYFNCPMFGFNYKFLNVL